MCMCVCDSLPVDVCVCDGIFLCMCVSNMHINHRCVCERVWLCVCVYVCVWLCYTNKSSRNTWVSTHTHTHTHTHARTCALEYCVHCRRVYACVCMCVWLRWVHEKVYTCMSMRDSCHTQDEACHNPPKNGLISLQTLRTSRFPTFYYCQVVNRTLLRLLSTSIFQSKIESWRITTKNCVSFCTIGNYQWAHSVCV